MTQSHTIIANEIEKMMAINEYNHVHTKIPTFWKKLLIFHQKKKTDKIVAILILFKKGKISVKMIIIIDCNHFVNLIINDCLWL